MDEPDGPGDEGGRRMDVITVGMADCQVSADRNSVLVTHALGSCVAVTIHDASAGVAGLLHLMLPDSRTNPDRARQKPFMFADTGIPDLFHAAYALGADKRRLTVRLIGGAQVLDPNGVFNIGKRNHLACRKVLWTAGVLIKGEEVGGTVSRTVRMEVSTGRILCSSAGQPSVEIFAGKGGA
jgi:chemotaxis protein CheD